MGSQIVLSQGFRCGVPSLGLWNYFIVLYFIKCYALHPAMQFVAMLCWIMKQLLLLALACLLLCNYFLYTQGWYHNCSYLLWWRCHLFHHAIWWCLVRDEKTSASCWWLDSDFSHTMQFDGRHPWNSIHNVRPVVGKTLKLTSIQWQQPNCF